jgi:hypothetical protein
MKDLDLILKRIRVTMTCSASERHSSLRACPCANLRSERLGRGIVILSGGCEGDCANEGSGFNIELIRVTMTQSASERDSSLRTCLAQTFAQNDWVEGIVILNGGCEADCGNEGSGFNTEANSSNDDRLCFGTGFFAPRLSLHNPRSE